DPCPPVQIDVPLDEMPRPATAELEQAREGKRRGAHPRTNLAARLRNAHAVPATAITASTATWSPALTGSAQIVPRASPRVSSTPCQRGDSQAIGWIAAGRFEIGKNVPENRKS